DQEGRGANVENVGDQNPAVGNGNPAARDGIKVGAAGKGSGEDQTGVFPGGNAQRQGIARQTRRQAGDRGDQNGVAPFAGKGRNVFFFFTLHFQRDVFP